MEKSNVILFSTYNYPPMLGGIASYSKKIIDLFPKSKVLHPRNLTHYDNSLPYYLSYPSVIGATLINCLLALRLLFSNFRILYALEMQASYPLFLLSLLTGKPLFVTAHGNDVIFASKRKILRFAASIIFRRCKKIICVSNATRELVINNFDGTDDKTVVIYPPINIERWVSAINQLPERNQNKLLCVGKLEYGKGFHLAIKALQYLPDEYKLTIIGDGPDIDMLNKMAIGFNGRVNILHRIDNIEELAGHYSSSLCLLVPSIYDQIGKIESFGQVIVEAKIFRTPTIGSNMGGIPEAMGNFGIAIDLPITPQKIAKAILSIDKCYRYTYSEEYRAFSTESFLKDLNKISDFELNDHNN